METLLSSPTAAEILDLYGREAVKSALRDAIGEGEVRPEALLAGARRVLAKRFAPTLRRAINGTGVLLHTNLGRAPLSGPARQAVGEAATGYSTLEWDPEQGARGSRQDHVRRAARELFGAEDALVVNNNAAAVLLALAALARGRRVLISRGELVAIGGSFKIPEILEASGASLAEVGTTNRTKIEDYRRGLTGEVALILTVHPSNYAIRGYTASPDPAEIAALAREAGIPWVHDQGTGCVMPLEEFGVPDEPTVAQCLARGPDLVTFSGDKLFAGPQAGFVVGRSERVRALASNPLARALRPDKLTLAALATTLTAWRTETWRDLPVYRAAGASIASLEERGERIRRAAADGRLNVEVVASEAVFGGGTSPEKTVPSRALALRAVGASAEELAASLRARPSPIVGRIEQDLLLLDLRSIAPEEDEDVAAALRDLAVEEA